MIYIYKIRSHVLRLTNPGLVAKTYGIAPYFRLVCLIHTYVKFALIFRTLSTHSFGVSEPALHIAIFFCYL